jgi:hypothetical protein
MKTASVAARRLVASGLALFCCAILAAIPVIAQIPSPESVLGFKPGTDRKLADWDQVVGYFQKLAAAAPDRVKLQILGQTTMGRPLIVLTITSAENMKNLEHYRQIQTRLANPAGLSDAEADRLISEAKVIVMQTCTVHSTEVTSTQTSMQFAYELLTQDTPENRAILNDAIYLLFPSINPDGQDMVVKWYNKYLGTPYEGADFPFLYNKYVGHDDNRDWYMFTQKESRLVVGFENSWHPQLIYDVHQMGPTGARMFMPPFLDPTDPNINPALVSETNFIGSSMAAALAVAGKQGVVINGVYDEWTPSRHYQAYHYGIRVLTESASAALATPINIPFSALGTHELGYNTQERSWNFPDPWPGGKWGISDIFSYQMITYHQALLTMAQNKSMFLHGFYEMGKQALSYDGSPVAYVFPPEQWDTPTEVKLLNTLKIGEVDVYRARTPFTADGLEYPAGTYIVPIKQLYGRYAKTLLELQHYPDIRQYPGGPPQRPYDVTAQTLPLLMGVRAIEIDQPFQADMQKVAGDVPLPVGTVQGSGSSYLLSPRANNAYEAVNRLFKEGGAQIGRTTEAINEGGQEFPAGTFIIRGADVHPYTELGLNFVATDRAIPNAVPLLQPRVGVYRSYVASMNEGWMRFVLENYEFPYTTVLDKDIRAGNLNSSYDVIIIPDETSNAIVRGNARLPAGQTVLSLRGAGGNPGSGFSDPEPDEYAGGIGPEGVRKLREFIERGGILAAINSASDFAIEQLGVGAQNILHDVPDRDFYCPGSILRIEVDDTDPIAYGMPEESMAWFLRSPAFTQGYLGFPHSQTGPSHTFTNLTDAPGAKAVMTYPGADPLMSGWLLGENLIESRAALMDAPLGKGHVILFGFDPLYRAQAFATFKVLFNAIFYPR